MLYEAAQEAQDDQAPTVRITHPGADAKVLPIEEVSIDVSGQDDFAELPYEPAGTPWWEPAARGEDLHPLANRFSGKRIEDDVHTVAIRGVEYLVSKLDRT